MAINTSGIMVIDPFSMILLPVMINIVTAPLDVKVLLKRLKNREKPINHDLQKAIKIAYLQALLEITQEFKAGRIESFRLYLPTELDQKIEYWKTELKQVENAKNETEISSPLQDTAEIEQLLLSHGKPIGDRLKELETRLISQALQGIADIPPDYKNQIQTNLFSRIYAHFVEQLKINDRAYRAFELEYLPAINASLTEIGIGQEQVALTMTDMLSVVNRTDQNVQKIIDILNPKSLTLEDWQEICRQNLAQQKQLTTNPFTNANGVTPQLDEIYVPLAIVERKPPKLPSRNQPEEKEEEKLIPIAEECFFEDVLRQGKSEISQGRKIAIIGEPGSGKTTRLQKIADWILEQDLGLPIWISLADLTQPTITQYIEDIWLKQTGKSLTIEELTQQKERIWLLLDGLDEMTSRVETRHVSALLGGWVQGARVVVTCRVNVWEADKNAFSGFDVFRNLEFNPEQVTDYIRRWFAGMRDAATGESLEAALAESENSRLKELIQNPLRLWMLCQIWQTGGGLPETQAGLYGQFVDWVYDWKEDKEILDQREAIDTALARLALAAMEQKDELLRLRLRESWVLKVLGSRRIFQAVMKLGWLNRVERFPEAICVFYHATFQEYFAALAVDDWDYFLPRNHVNFPVEGKEYRIFEPQWKQVILLWLGRGDVADEEKEGFIEKLVNFDDGCGEFYKYRAYFLAAAGISEYRDCALTQEIISTVFDWSTSDLLAGVAKATLLETDRTKAIDWLMKTIIKFVTEKRLYYSDRVYDNFISEINYICHKFPTSSFNLIHFAEILGELAPRNQLANDMFDMLVWFAQSGDTIYIRRDAVFSLIRISKYLPTVINDELVDYLVSLSDPRNGSTASIEGVWYLCLLGKSELISSNFVLQAFSSAFDNFWFNITWDISRNINSVHKQTFIDALVEFINVFSSDLLREEEICEAVWCLWQVDKYNPLFTDVLVEIINRNGQEWVRSKAAEILGLIEPENLLARQTLIHLLRNNDNDPNFKNNLLNLLRIKYYDEITVKDILKVIKSNSYLSITILNKLPLVKFEEQQWYEIIYQLSVHLSETEQKDSSNYDACRSLLWNCSQSMIYSDFYKSWYHK
ncbi:NACHT domain-containing protein [Planktothrix paucivesiculata]|uniref:NACHT domain-containing protein n=2 Tax=Planktothrix TaxID=54304 RepID=A0A7Z9DZ11_9CYAN|nr:NACHT domain-containing protein [Planktothrix paucivesiculata]VXD16848.1 hypothetical protein PL9631_250082 [Planktothrix paucivesiculata PCC 9631]